MTSFHTTSTCVDAHPNTRIRRTLFVSQMAVGQIFQQRPSTSTPPTVASKIYYKYTHCQLYTPTSTYYKQSRPTIGME